MEKYDVWMEGYSIQGDTSKAYLLGTEEALTFKEACVKLLERLGEDKQLGWKMTYYKPETNTYWGCRFFNNEADARKSFG